jgi:hypothetical protein
MTAASTLLCDCGDPDCPGRVPMSLPFGLAVNMVSGDTQDAELYLTVRTTSWDFDGERTDVHDILSLLWAATLRVREVASTRLVTVLNPAIQSDSEIYARYLLLAQPGGLRIGCALKPRAEILSHESAKIHALVFETFGFGKRENSLDPEYSGNPDRDWIASVRRRLRFNESVPNWETRARSCPRWIYFGSNLRGVTVAEIGSHAAARLKEVIGDFKPRVIEGVDAILYRTDQFSNAVRKKTLARLAWLVKQADGQYSPLVIVPTDSHVIAIGSRSIAAVRDMAGRDVFDAEREKLTARHSEEAAWLNVGRACRWAEVIEDSRFEQFVGELLALERGVRRVRQVGATREPDDGRDFLVDWITAPDRGGNTWNRDGPLSEEREVIVQVKVRRSGVGRSDLPGIRDTLEHYRCGGLLVVAFPRITVSLMNHLAELRRRGQWWVEWWGQTELEERVRRYPELAGRFPDLIRLDGT